MVVVGSCVQIFCFFYFLSFRYFNGGMVQPMCSGSSDKYTQLSETSIINLNSKNDNTRVKHYRHFIKYS